jgi:hypothetical protein
MLEAAAGALPDGGVLAGVGVAGLVVAAGAGVAGAVAAGEAGVAVAASAAITTPLCKLLNIPTLIRNDINKVFCIAKRDFILITTSDKRLEF